MDENRRYANITISEKENAEVEIKGEIPAEQVNAYRDGVVKDLGKTAEAPGFRKGHVPKHILIQKFGEQSILEKTAEKALRDTYPLILKEHRIKAVGNPHITVTKLASGNPIGFTIVTAVYPEFPLPDYKTIAKEVLAKRVQEEISVSDKELEETILNIRKSMVKKKDEDATGTEPPVLTEELVKSWNFDSVPDFKTKLRGDMQREKEMREKEKARMAIADAVIEKAVIPLPEMFVEAEQNKMLAEFKGRIKQMGLSFDDYLKRIEKTEEKLRGEWKPDAIKRAKLQLILNKIAEAEDIKAEKEKVDERVKHVLEHHNKDANEDSVRRYITALLTNEKVFEFLERQ